MTPPIVSVIIPAYNSEAYVEEAVASALDQTYRRVDVIVVDDGSTDGTAARLARFGDEVHVIRQANEGVYRARNNGLAAARGRYVAFLDADDVWTKDKLAVQMDVFARNPEVAVVASRVEEIDALGRPLEREVKELRGIYDRPVNLYRDLLMSGNPVSLSSAVARRDVLDEAGGFYARERILSADYDLWIRLAKENLFWICSRPLTRYRVLKDSLLHGSLEKEYGAQLGIIERNRHRFPARDYRRRVARLYRDWAESAFDQRDASAWAVCRRSLGLDPFQPAVWSLAGRNAVKNLLGRLGAFEPA